MISSVSFDTSDSDVELLCRWSSVSVSCKHNLQERIHSAIISILNYRFFGCEVFPIEKWANNKVETAEVVIDGTATLSQLRSSFESLKFSEAVDQRAQCGLALWMGKGELSELSHVHLKHSEIVFQIDQQNETLTVHFCNDKHDRRTAEIWLSVYQSLAQRFAREECLDQPIGVLDLTNDQIRQTVLEFGTRHTLDSAYSNQPSEDFTFHRQFEKQAAISPSRIAVWAKETAGDDVGVEWDYETLNRNANAIAEFLIKAGVKVEDTVGIVMDRRVCLLAALLGVMKAGGRYVGLEPELPEDRLTFMMNDASVKFIITEDAHVECAKRISNSAQPSALAILNWDDTSFQQTLHDNTASGQLDRNPVTKVHSRNSAYLIYTSGSTGLPKGVDVWHHSFVDLCRTFIDTLELDENDTGLGIATIAFDASICELFPPLLVGGKAGIGHKRAGANGRALSKLIEEVSATYMFATPTSLRVLVASGWKESPNLTVIAGGEAVSSLVCREIGPRVKRLLNGYGPSETTVFATLGPLSSTQSDPVPIGEPILNSRAYVLDEHGNLLPPMVPGELFIGGQSPARGYLNRPELTEKKFRPDPFAASLVANATASDDEVEPKMYASGDVVYWGHDGSLYYMGRNDHQVKLRGYRIELGEIETRLCNHRSVKDAVAMVREDEPGQQRLVAYVVYKQQVADAVLQDHLLTDMPEYMVPTWFVPLESLPVNANLKLDRKALPNPDDVAAGNDDQIIEAKSGGVSPDQLAAQIAATWSSILNRKIRIEDQVFRMGADSLTAVKFQVQLLEQAGLDIPIGEVFQYPSPLSLAQQIGSRTNPNSDSNQVRRQRANTGPVTDIAVVGLAGRFPGAPNVDAFWENLVDGVESIREFSEEELIAAGVSAADYLSDNYVARGTVLDGAYDFEPEFFGVTRSDAEVVSPQIRLFMKTAWEALEVAGYPEEPTGHRIGVFAGCGNPNYLMADRHVPEAQRLQRLIGNGADFLATRTAYALGLTGPAIGIQTACSTSLVAVAHAVNAIRSGQCEMAIAGGSSCSWPMGEGYQHGAGLIYSADGHCRTFDDRASGTIFSQASGAILLRPLQDAINAGDTIHAVIKGVGVNNDGARKGGYAAPSIQGQCEVIQAALDDAEVSAGQITLVEAHGTATKIGDPIEVSGLNRAWQRDTQEKQFCAIGSVKANVGHADAAAGIVGLLKVIMSLKHKTIPPLVNYETPNPEIVFSDTPFYVNTEAIEWESDQPTRLAAISSFGMGGTNAHLIVAEGQSDSGSDANDAEVSSTPQLIPFSARTNESLRELVDVWSQSDDLQKHRFSDIAFTLQSGRKHFARRAFAVVDSRQQLRSAISSAVADDPANDTADAPELFFGNNKAIKRKVVFLFTGQGAQYPNMARDLYQSEPVFREALDQCDTVLKEIAGGLTEWLFSDEPACDINQTQYAQVALFSVSYAQAKLWQSWGVAPDAMIGHSIGEYAAAAIAGVISLKDALTIVAKRGQLMQSMPAGSMLAVMHHDHDINTLLTESDGLDLAVVNSRSVAVVAGPDDAIERFAALLQKQDIKSKKLHTSHAFHSSMMDPILESFVDAFEGVQLSEAQIPYLSNVSGTWVTKEQVTDPNYFAQQIRSTVKFAENLETLMESEEDYLFIELGPGSTLTQISKTQFSGGSHAAVATLPGPKQADADSRKFAWEALGRCWAEGLDIQWKRLQPKSDLQPRRIALPTYCFNEQTYRAEKEYIGASPSADKNGSWFNVPVWKQDHLTEHLEHLAEAEAQQDDHATDANRWLVFSAGQSLSADAMRTVLKAPPGQTSTPEVITILAGKRYAKDSDHQYTIRADQFADYQQLLQDIEAESKLAGVIHGWTLSDLGGPASSNDTSDFWNRQRTSTLSLAWLSKAIGEVVVDHAVALDILTQGVADLDPNVTSQPHHHCFLGGAAVIQKEFRAIQTKVIDVGSNVSTALTHPLLGKLLTSHLHEPLIALDRGNWWKKDYDRASLPSDASARIHNGSVIVSTGGLGGLARNMALQLANQYQDLKVVLLARNVLPPEEQWDQILAEESDNGSDGDSRTELQQRIVDYRQLKSLCEVSVVECDVSDQQQFLQALKRCNKQFGKIDLLLHTAGVLNDGVVASKTWEQLEPVLAAKSLAADVCCQYIRMSPDAVGSLVFFSSIASDIGLFGQFAYSAANNYLDGLSQQMSQAAGDTKVFSVNWPAFRDVGMAVRSQVDLSSDADLQREIAENSLTVAEGTEALVGIVNNLLHSRVVVFKHSYSDRCKAATQDGRSVDLKASGGGDVASNGTGSASVEDRMMEIWRQQFGNESLTLEDDYFELGGDSLMAVGMIAHIEKAFGKMVPISHLINSPTPRKLIRKLGLAEDHDQLNDTDVAELDLPATVICLKQSQSKSKQPPLLLLHGADGAVMFYREFANRLKTESTIYGFESPLLSDPEFQIPDSVEELAAIYVATIRTVQPQGPYRIGGYSFGGVLGYEIASQLESAGEKIETLILYDIGNPALLEHNSALERLKCFWDNQESKSASTKVFNLAKRIGKSVKERTTVEIEHRMSKLATAETLESSFWRHKKSRERHMAIEENYVPEAIGCPVRVVSATGNSSKFRIDEDMGWAGVAADLRIEQTEGSHLELFDEQYVDQMVRSTEIFLAESN